MFARAEHCTCGLEKSLRILDGEVRVTSLMAGRVRVVLGLCGFVEVIN